MAPSARTSPGQSRGDLTPGGGLTDSEGVLGQDGRGHGAGSGGLGRSRVLPWASGRRRPEEGRRRPGAGNPKAAVGGAWGAGRGPGSRCPGEPGEERRGRRKRPGPERERGGRTSPRAGPAPGAASERGPPGRLPSRLGGGGVRRERHGRDEGPATGSGRNQEGTRARTLAPPLPALPRGADLLAASGARSCPCARPHTWTRPGRAETCPARLAPLACQPGPSSSLTLQSL